MSEKEEIRNVIQEMIEAKKAFNEATDKFQGFTTNTPCPDVDKTVQAVIKSIQNNDFDTEGLTNMIAETIQDCLISDVINMLDVLKAKYPHVEVTLETPDGTVSCEIGDALIYQNTRGNLIIDAE